MRGNKNEIIEGENFFIPLNIQNYLIIDSEFILKKDYYIMNKFCKNHNVDIEEFYDEQGFLLEKGRIISFSLEQKLDGFPHEILGLDNLKGINISKNYIKTIPWKIDNLSNLNYIYADDCGLEKIPGSFLYMNFNFLELEDNNLNNESLKIIAKLKEQGLDVKV